MEKERRGEVPGFVGYVGGKVMNSGLACLFDRSQSQGWYLSKGWVCLCKLGLGDWV